MTEGPAEALEVAVWDWPVRVVHWAMVALVVTLLATGLSGGSAVMVWHMRAGEALLALVLFRILWGFAGSGNARFASFVRGPREVMRHLRSCIRPPHQVHATHNPAGGWMVVALLVVLLVQCGLGLFTHDDVMTEGPLVGRVSEDLSDVLSALHRRGWWLVAGLATVHILAVVVSGLWCVDDNLISRDVHGHEVAAARDRRSDRSDGIDGARARAAGAVRGRRRLAGHPAIDAASLRRHSFTNASWHFSQASPTRPTADLSCPGSPDWVAATSLGNSACMASASLSNFALSCQISGFALVRPPVWETGRKPSQGIAASSEMFFARVIAASLA